MTNILLRSFILISFFSFSQHAEGYKTVSEFDAHLNTLEYPSVEQLLPLAPYINGEKFTLTRHKIKEAVEQDHKVIFKYLSLAKIAAGDNAAAQQEVLKAIKGTPGDALKAKEITDTHVQIHRAIAMSLFGAKEKDLKEYLGAFEYEKDFQDKVRHKFGDKFQNIYKGFDSKKTDDISKVFSQAYNLIEKEIP